MYVINSVGKPEVGAGIKAFLEGVRVGKRNLYEEELLKTLKKALRSWEPGR